MWPPYHKAHDGRVLQSLLSLWKFLSSPQRISEAQSEHQFIGHILYEGYSLPVAQFGWVVGVI